MFGLRSHIGWEREGDGTGSAAAMNRGILQRGRERLKHYGDAPRGRLFMDEIDIWRTAHLLITQHGEDAVSAAAGRADAMFATGDKPGGAVWLQILRAISDFERRKPRAGEAVN